MKSAPASTCCRSRNGSRRVSTRPPTRACASMTVTPAPFFDRSRAADRPASPAPATMTETLLREGNSVLAVEVARENQLQLKFVRSPGQAETGARLHLEELRALVEHGVQLMRLVAAWKEPADRSEIRVGLSRHGERGRHVVGDARGRHEFKILDAVILRVDDRVDDDVDPVQMPADDGANLRREAF